MNEKVKSMLKAVGYLVLSFLVQFIVAMGVMIFIFVKKGNTIIANSGFDANIFMSEYMKKMNFIMAVYSVLTILIIALIFTIRKKKSWIEFRLNNFNIKNTLIGIAIGVAGWLVNSVVLTFIYNIGMFKNSFIKLSESSEMLIGGNAIINIITVGILVPLAEEFVFRGAILRTLKKSMKIKYAILIQAILFGIAHGNLIQFMYTVFLGCILGYVAYKSKSLWPAIAIHMTNNIIATVASGALDVVLQNNIAALLILIASVIGIIFAIKAVNKANDESMVEEIIIK